MKRLTIMSGEHLNPADLEKRCRGVSPAISAVIISGIMLIILGVASFVSMNLLELQLASTEFEQAKSNMLLLDEVIHDVALRRGSGGYVQFNQRSGGIGIQEREEDLTILVGPPGEEEVIYSVTPLISIVYRGGGSASGSEMTLRGVSSLMVNMSSMLSHVRTEFDEGICIKLDYDRVRVIDLGEFILCDGEENILHRFVEISIIRLSKGPMGGSGTINLKAQNMGVNVTTRTYQGGNLSIKVRKGILEEGISIYSGADETVIIITEADIRIST
ncbi:MAG: hypothetical protein QW639_06360 [Candidatus Bathyarchaeia archaeon]